MSKDKKVLNIKRAENNMPRERGVVKWFNSAKGYGFLGVIGKEETNDIFVHFSAINANGYKTLHEGDIVEFDVEKVEKGLQAIDVVIIEQVNAEETNS